jgi:hypothetical protein
LEPESPESEELDESEPESDDPESPLSEADVAAEDAACAGESIMLTARTRPHRRAKRISARRRARSARARSVVLMPVTSRRVQPAWERTAAF